MRRFQKILFVNQPANVSGALERALQLARNNEAQLDVINIYEDLPASLSKLESALKKQQRDQLSGLMERSGLQIPSMKHFQRNGTPFLEIILEVLQNSYDLVIKPAQGHSRLSAVSQARVSTSGLRRYHCMT